MTDKKYSKKKTIKATIWTVLVIIVGIPLLITGNLRVPGLLKPFFNIFYRGELKVVKCNGKGTSKTIAFNNKTGDLYEYDQFTEGYVKKGKTNNEYNDSGAGLLGRASSDINKTSTSIFVGNDLKVKEKQSGSFQMNMYSSRINTTAITTIFDAKKNKTTYKGSYSYSGFNGFKDIYGSVPLNCKSL